MVVSRARAQLGADVIASTPTGYRLSLAEEQVDTSAVLLRAAASAPGPRRRPRGAGPGRGRPGAVCGAPDGADAGLDDQCGGPAGGAGAGLPALARARALALSRLGRHAEAAEALAGHGASSGTRR